MCAARPPNRCPGCVLCMVLKRCRPRPCRQGGELRGLDFRFKTASSLFRKLMSRLDTTMSACNMSERPPTAGEILSGILDILRYTAVRPSTRVAHQPPQPFPL